MLILLIHRVGVAHGIPAANKRCHVNKERPASQQAIVSSANSQKIQSDSFLQAFAKAFLKYIRYTANVIIVGCVFYFTPAFWKTINESSRYLGRQPRPTYSLTQSYTREEPPLDNFVRNYPGFDAVQALTSDLNIDQSGLDLDSSNVVLDSSREILNLRSRISRAKQEGISPKRIRDAATLLDEIDTTSQLIWGRSGPDPDKVEQTRSNCQVMADIQGHFLTPQNSQKIKSQVAVKNFNPSLQNFRIDTEVKLNGETIHIPYEILVSWMMPGELASLKTGEGTLSTPILTYAIEKGLQKYGGVPNWFPSASATLLSGNDYCTIATTTLSDNELINVLSKAPETPTKLDTSGFDFTELSLKDVDFIGYWANVLNLRKQQSAPTPNVPRHTDISTRHFIQSVQPLIQQVESDKKNTTTASTNQHPTVTKAKDTKQKTKEKSKVSDIEDLHMYTVKKFDPKTQMTTIIDAQGFECDLTLDQVREHANFIISTTQNFPNLGSRGIKNIFLGLILLLSINKGPQAVKKLIAKNSKANQNASS